MTPEELRERALAEFAAQAKESVIVKTLERIAVALEAIPLALREPQTMLMRWPGAGPDSSGAYPGKE